MGLRVYGKGANLNKLVVHTIHSPENRSNSPKEQFSILFGGGGWWDLQVWLMQQVWNFVALPGLHRNILPGFQCIEMGRDPLTHASLLAWFHANNVTIVIKGSLRCAKGGFRDGEVCLGRKINAHGFIVVLMAVKTADIGRLTVPLQLFKCLDL
ncbi:hypothetical protein DVH24_014496 [Malus domestica]|uniref:Uncharacterized protein n=1 Tax=Malus domestica TaxID=3750 RepID=A0A498KI15_MALDO|nr:hypothetical protein DVH24_014496 [Malus domestica]